MSDSPTTCRTVRAAIRAAALLALAGWIAIAQTTHAVEPVFHPSLETATDAAAADQSLILLIFSAEWCGPCKLLKTQTLASPQFKEQDVPLHVVDIDVDANPKLAHDFAAQAIPTLVLLTPDGRIVLRETGYMDADNLKQWLQEGRHRAAAGQWEGAAPDDKLGDLKQKASIDELTTNDIRQLIELLADSNPANRLQAGKILLSQRESIVPGLIDAVGDPYLGQRIGAAELLLRLAPNVPPIDPWKSQPEMSNAVISLKQWWATTKRLPSGWDSNAAPVSRDSVREMIEQLRGDDPVRRTAAMTALIDQGRQILPQIRESIRKAEKSGDQRSVSLLEDVRWGVLVPDDLEQRTHVRPVLAHGKSPERQAAADRLGAAGKDAVESLKELATDPDTLVVESAIRNLAELGGGTAVTALSTLLLSPDGNLRMEAAQALGRTKDSSAVKPLLPVFKDTNEVVVCAAISALEDLHTSGKYDRTSRCSPDELAALKAALADSRWRVRAAAAEVIGTLELKDLSSEVRALLKDNDGFVVNKALLSLKKLEITPEASELAEISKRLPGLQGDATKMMLQSRSSESAEVISDMFNKGSNETRVVILRQLAAVDEDYSASDDGWKPLLVQAIGSGNPQLRLEAARVLEQHPSKLAATFLETLLTDDNRETRQAAEYAVLKILDRDTGGPRPNSYSTDSTKPKAMASAQQIAIWHKAVLKHLEVPPDFLTAVTVYVTGDPKENLEMVEATVIQPMDDTKAQQQINTIAVSVMLHSLPWPDGKGVVDKLSASPLRYACAAVQHNRAGKQISDYLMDSPRFKSVVEPVTGDVLQSLLEMVAGSDYDYNNRDKLWSFWKETPETHAIALALAGSTNTAWRAAALFSLGAPSFASQHSELFRNALSDPNPWVRASAIKSLAHAVEDQALIEQYVSPLLADTNSDVASVAAVALLQPEIRKAADLYDLDGFKYEEIDGGHRSISSRENDRPLTTLDSKPVFLDTARKWLLATNIENIAPFALLLAQYGDPQGTDKLAADPQVTDLNRSESEAALVAISLSRDAKYIPLLRKMTESEHYEWNLRKVLQALRPMTGPDARQLRLDINKKIRERNVSGD